MGDQHNVLQPIVNYAKEKLGDEARLVVEEAEAIFGGGEDSKGDKKRKATDSEALRAATVSSSAVASHISGPVSVAPQVVSKKRGHVRAGPWASRQVDRKAHYGRATSALDPVWRIDWAVAHSTIQLPFQPWKGNSFFQELWPNGLAFGNASSAATCDNDDASAQGWGIGAEAFVNTSRTTDLMTMSGATLPSFYQPDELEYPYINVLENHLRLIVRPGNLTCTARLLVLNVWCNEFNDAILNRLGANSFSLQDFIPVDSAVGELGKQRMMLPPRVGPIASHNWHPPICCFFTAQKQRSLGPWEYKVICDKTWHMSPGDTATRQVPFSIDIKYKNGNVQVSPSEEGKTDATCLPRKKSRIIWSFFYETADTEPVAPSLETATNTLPSYYGVYKLKWKLTPP